MPTSGFRRLARLVLVLGILLAVVGGGAAPASAHASLLTTDPVADSVLDAAPTAVGLDFTEGIQVQPDGVRVLNGAGERVDQGSASSTGTSVTAPLRSGLPDGGYVVAWRVVSEDGHPINGAFRFSIGVRTEVGEDVVDQAFSGSADARDEWAGRILRSLTYVAVLGACGAVLVGGGLRREGEPSPVNRVVGGLAALGIVASTAQVPFQASLVSGQGLGSVADQPVLELALADGFGWSVLMVCLGLLAIVLTTGLAFRTAVRWTATVGAVLAPLGLVVTGHTRTMSPALVGYLADAVHVYAGAIWFGGLCALLATIRRRRRAVDLEAAAEAVHRFSGWAMVSAGLVVVAGLVLTWIEVRSLSGLVDTSYGKLLLAKVAVVGLVLLAAAWNRFRFIPSLVADHGDHGALVDGTDDADTEAEPDDDGEPTRRGQGTDGPGWQRFRAVTRAEVVGIVIVLGLTGVLSNLTPAKAAVEETAGDPFASAPFGERRIDVVVDPGRTGANDLHVYVLDDQDKPDDAYDMVEVRLSLPAQDVGPLELEPVRAGPGHFQVVNTDIPLAGEWDVVVVTRPDRFTEIKAEVTVTIR